MADWVPPANDAAAVLGVDENQTAPALEENVAGAERSNTTDDDNMDVDLET